MPSAAFRCGRHDTSAARSDGNVGQESQGILIAAGVQGFDGGELLR